MTMTKQKVVAVTACPTGIAHTFMAANKINAWAKERNIEVKVETQGSDGVKKPLNETGYRLRHGHYSGNRRSHSGCRAF